ncbi:MAG: M10 family metallopeptidase C-terminal domain-containing protein [Pseudomonadota bacterium]
MFANHAAGCACAHCRQGPPDQDELGGRADATAEEIASEGTPTKPVYDQTGIVRALTTADAGRGSIAWRQDEVSFSIGTGRAASDSPVNTAEYTGYVAMSAAQEAAAREAFQLWDDLIDIDLVEETDDPTADITFNYSSNTGGGTYARYYYSLAGNERADYSMVVAQAWMGSTWWTHDEDSDLYLGGYGVLTYLHEIGHTLGLTHPGQYNGSASYTRDATHFQDTRAFTLMSYFDAQANGSGADHLGTQGRSFAATPLLNDIVAVQSLYGADMTTRTGNTVYGFGSNADRDAFDFTININPVVAIWDAGGIDTINVSRWNMDQEIDLAEGGLSSVGHLSQNLAIAPGAVIENATAGGGDDLLFGNDVRNILRGGAGDDDLFGGRGNDVLDGGRGADRLFGGDGVDFINYRKATEGVSFDLASGTGDGGWAEGDIFQGIERAVGSDHGDFISGSRTNDVIKGVGGDDQISGAAGDDRIYGGGGEDGLDGGAGRDWLDGGAGDDQLSGGGGNDWLIGGAGADQIDGGAGIDLARYDNAAIGVRVDLAAGRGFRNDAAGDTYSGVEGAVGSRQGDLLFGDAGTNRLIGRGGDDTLNGRDGRDFLTGGGGADRFIFGADGGADVITDFQTGIDTIQIADGASFSDLSIALYRGSSLMIDLGDGGSIVLRNVDTLLGEENFVFA